MMITQLLNVNDMEFAIQSNKVLSDILKKYSKDKISVSIQVNYQISTKATEILARAEIPFPLPAIEILTDVLEKMGKGNIVNISTSMKNELNTKEAAEFLNIIHQNMITLLEEETIPFHYENEIQKIKLDDLINYKKKRSHKRDQLLKELTEEAQEFDLGY